MKVNAFRNRELKYTGDLWTFVTTRDAEGGAIRTFNFARSISFNAVTGNFGKVDAHFNETESDVVILHQVANFRGPDGKELQVNGVWQVEQIAPAINIWGRQEGYRVRLAFLGTDNSA